MGSLLTLSLLKKQLHILTMGLGNAELLLGLILHTHIFMEVVLLVVKLHVTLALIALVFQFQPLKIAYFGWRITLLVEVPIGEVRSVSSKIQEGNYRTVTFEQSFKPNSLPVWKGFVNINNLFIFTSTSRGKQQLFVGRFL